MSTTFLAICLFLFFMSFKNVRASRISRMGERDSLYIYIFHPMFLIVVLPKLLSKMSPMINEVYQWVAPVLVLFLTIIFTVILRKMKIIK